MDKRRNLEVHHLPRVLLRYFRDFCYFVRANLMCCQRRLSALFCLFDWQMRNTYVLGIEVDG